MIILMIGMFWLEAALYPHSPLIIIHLYKVDALAIQGAFLAN